VGADARDALLVIGLQSDDEQVSRIVAILRQLEIPAQVMAPRVAAADAGSFAVRVPAERVVAAVLALEHHGFTRVRAYDGDSPG